MGRNNRQRRDRKHRREERRHAGAFGRDAGGFDGADPVDVLATLVDQGVRSGVTAAARGDRRAVREIAEALVELGRGGLIGLVAAVVGDVVDEVLQALWESGWQPAEVAHVAGRRGREDRAGVVMAAMAGPGCWSRAAGAAMPEPWAEQLGRLGVAIGPSPSDDWFHRWLAASGFDPAAGIAVAVEALGELAGCCDLEPILAPPSAWRRGAAATAAAGDHPVLSKVRALLAKAESTPFAAEAEALTAKAQELMARHAIDEALARSATPDGEAPTMRRVLVDDPYAEAKSTLLRVVIAANRSRGVWYDGLAMMAVVGYAADLERVELLFTSLLVQATRAMLAKGPVTDGHGRSRTRSFRQSFLLAYAGRIRERLELAAATARRQAEDELAVSLLPVLASQDRQVDEALAKAFPNLDYGSGPTATNEAGWRAGRLAAELASLGPEQGQLDGMAAAG